MLSAFSGFPCSNNMVKENSLVPFKQDSTVTQKPTCDPKAFCKSYFTSANVNTNWLSRQLAYQTETLTNFMFIKNSQIRLIPGK